MKTFTITATTPKVMAKELNPLGERPKFYPLVGGFEVMVVGSDRTRYFAEKLSLWQEAENNLKEYELTEESTRVSHKVIYEAPGGSYCEATFRDFKIGQVIEGKAVNENGIEKIQL